MSALPLLDMYLSLAPDAAGSAMQRDARASNVAERLVQSALNRHAEIDELDVCAETAPVGAGAGEAQAAVLIRAMYDEWAREAEAILDRILVLERDGVRIARADQLRDQVGRVRAMLSISLRDIAKGRQQLKEGRTYSVEGVRRELRLGA